ncbi:MAG: type II/IV secretion system protein [Arcobacter sp.]|nr:MAG: type II/IV secretion system protein [Arcobacter sp.]
MKTFKELIDYSCFEQFDIKKLQEYLVLPIKYDGIYFKCFICEKSNLKAFNIKGLVRSEYLNKDEILFFLSDINIRIKLFELAIKAKNSENIKDTSIEDFFSLLIKKAIEMRSSDIHIESLENNMVIRFRVDGNLKLFYIFENEFLFILSSYIKMISKLDITMSRLPMDGRFSLYIKNYKYDFRVSTMPTINGESIVIRVLDNKNIKKTIEELGFSKNIFDEVENITALTQGLVLVSGPTGSGKSTTLYSILKKLNTENKKIITIEDPVEYKLEQTQQVSVDEELGLSFITILKTVLRQDPDILLIGEIRDSDSLNIALQASLTGHLVLASIHANNSLETLSRLIDLKADRYLLSSALKYIISQRLVLNICQSCFQKGCVICNFTGFYNRSSIAEVLKIDESISSFIFRNVELKSIKEYLKTKGFKSMIDDGKQKVEKRITTIEEVYKVVNS